MRGSPKWVLSGLAIAAGVAIALIVLKQPSPAPIQQDPREALIDAVATRALGIENPASLRVLLDGMPLGLIDRATQSRVYREAIWSEFFKGSLLKLGGLESERPLALFYNPVFDVAVVRGCDVAVNGQPLSCDLLCALPGEALAGEPVTDTPPGWLTADDPLRQLRQLTSMRVRAFEAAHPANGANVVQWRADYCGEKLQAAAELRMIEGVRALSGLETAAFQSAIADYLQKAASEAETGQGSTDDVVLQLLLNASELSLAAAIPAGDKDWLVFLMPNQTGWQQAVLRLSKARDGRLAIEGVSFLAFTTAGS